MLGLTDHLAKQSWENTLTAIECLSGQAVQTAKCVLSRGPAPEYDDAQIVTIDLAADDGLIAVTKRKSCLSCGTTIRLCVGSGEYRTSLSRM